MAFGMINWNDALRKKQQVAQQGADADTTRARASMMGAEAAVALTPAQIAQAEASAAVERARATGMPDLMSAQALQARGAAANNFAISDQTNLQTDALATVGTREIVDSFRAFLGMPVGEDSPIRSASYTPPAPVTLGRTSSQAAMSPAARTGAFGAGGARRITVERRPRVGTSQTGRGMPY